MTITISRLATLLCVTSVLFAYGTVASADHSVEEESHSHASTITVTKVSTEPPLSVIPITGTTIDVDRVQTMQALLKALQELVVLLEHKLEHEDEGLNKHNHEDHA